MRVGQLLDFILLHILKIFRCVNLGFFAKIWLFNILCILNRCLNEPLTHLNEILQLVRNSHHSSFWHNSLCFISSHSSDVAQLGYEAIFYWLIECKCFHKLLLFTKILINEFVFSVYVPTWKERYIFIFLLKSKCSIVLTLHW